MALGPLVPLVLFLIFYAVWVVAGYQTGVARVDGTVRGLGLQGPARIVRDGRDIPHIRATTLHDAFFAEGYAMGSDRLFQIDITRRYVFGRLAEMFGPPALAVDQNERLVDVAGIVEAQYRALDPAQRAYLQAFADGINAAATREPAPPEYHALLFGFEPWRPQDSLAVGFATILTLTDNWYDVIARDAVLNAAGPRGADAFFSLTDPAWETPAGSGTPLALPSLPPLHGIHAPAAVAEAGDPRAGLGSNEWAAGAARTATGRALLANDPHLGRSIPGIWYLVDVDAPGLHVAGATLAGVPGVILGHNERVAWGATNATVAGPRVYAERFVDKVGTRYRAGTSVLAARERSETFHVRLGGDKTKIYLTTRHGFVLEDDGVVRHAVAWDPVEHPRAAQQAFLQLDRASSIEDALQALAAYPGPPENFVLADVSGRAAYAMAGAIPDDPAWGLHVLDGARPLVAPPAVPFARLPRVAPGRTVVTHNANDLPYAAGYPYRLSPWFTAPYRDAEIAQRLRGMQTFRPADFSPLQSDTTSVGERELARAAVAALRKERGEQDPDLKRVGAVLAAFDGRFDPDSRGATMASGLRQIATRDLFAMHFSKNLAGAYLNSGPAFVTLLRAIRERPRGWFPHDDVDAFLTAEVRAAVAFGGYDRYATPYGDAYAYVAEHPLASLGFRFWNGPRVRGSGGSYAPAVEGPVLGQSFRAVWDVGAWDAGGITIPLGESGEPHSPHYTDLAPAFARDELVPLPFSDAALARDTTATLTLTK